jgi:hypothetical protein
LQPGAYKKACVLLTSFVWEFEHAISKLAGLFEEVGPSSETMWITSLFLHACAE